MGHIHMAKTPSWYRAPRNRAKERSLLAIVAVVLLAFVALAGTIFAYYFVPNPDLLTSLDADRLPDRVQHVEFADTELLIPARVLSRIKTRPLRGVYQVDLHFAWPYRSDADIVRPEDIKDYSNYVLVSLIETPEGYTQADKFRLIYPAYLDGAPRPAVSNLRQYTFRSGSPYASLDIFTARSGDSLIVYTCDKQASSLGPRLCERTYPLNERISLRYRLAFENLASWFKIDATVNQLIDGMVHFRSGG
jgi:hypothetical protein